MSNETADLSGLVVSATDQAPRAAPDRSQKNAVVLGITGAVAGDIAHVVTGLTGSMFEISQELIGRKQAEGQHPSDDMRKQFYEYLSVLDYLNTAFSIAIIGAIVGVLFGLMRRILRRSRSSILIDIVAGPVVGCAFAAGAGLLASCLWQNVISFDLARIALRFNGSDTWPTGLIFQFEHSFGSLMRHVILSGLQSE
jgi:hypothetical protein